MLKKPKPRGIYLAVKIILLKISTAKDIYLQLELDIYLQLDRHIFTARDRYLDCIHKIDFVEHRFCSRFVVAHIVQL